MKTWVFIGIFGGPGRCELYRDPSGKAPQFGTYSQACDYITRHGLGLNASPIEVSEYDLPIRTNG